MSEFRLLVLPHRKFKAHDVHMERVTITEALERHWDNEHALVTYFSPTEETIPRLKKSALKGLREAGAKVLISCLVLDYDLHDDNGKRPWMNPDEAEGVIAEIFQAQVPVPTAYYTTKHGLRLIYELEEPMTPEHSEQAYQELLDVFQRAGIEMDQATSDWTRIFFLPYIEKGGEKLWDLDYIFHQETGIKLDGSKLVISSVLPVQGLTLDGDQPEAQGSDALLHTRSAQGQQVMTAFMKQAKTLLGNGSDAPWLFENQSVPFDRGCRNDGIWKLIGRVTVRLWGKIDGLTPEHVYALLRPGVAQLPMEGGDADPCAVLWEQTQRTWESKHEETEVKRVTFEEAQSKMVDGFRDQCRRSGKVLEDLAFAVGDTEVDYTRRRLIVSTGTKGIYLMQVDGTYFPFPISQSGMVGRIQDMGLAQIYDINGMDGQLRPEAELFRLRGISVSHAKGELGLSSPELRDIGKDTMHMALPLHYLRVDLKPLFVPEVDKMLRLFAGENYERLADWISHALDVTKPICALSISGAPGAGKSFLGEILGACFAPGDKNGDEVLTTNFNLGLKDNPVVHIDEGLSTAKHVDELLRVYVSGGKLSLIGKGKDPIKAEVYPRVLISANDLDALRDALGRRDLGDAAHAALAVRILHLDARDEAADWLAKHNGRELTGDWLVGRSLAVRHFLWMHAQRNRPSQWVGSGRFLVEGDKDSEMLQEFRYQTEGAQVVLGCLLDLFNARGKGVLTIEGRDVWVSSNTVHKHLETTVHNKMTQRAIANVLGKVGESSRGAPGAYSRHSRVYRLKLEVLIVYAQEHGIRCDTLFAIAEGTHQTKGGTVWPTE